MSVDHTPPALADRVRQTREQLVASGTVVARADDVMRELFPVAIGVSEGSALREWVRKERAMSTLETGLGYGIATLFILEGLLENGGDIAHVAIDPYQFETLPGQPTTYEGAGLQILKEAGVHELVEFYEAGSEIVLPQLLNEGRRFDLAFIDGNHRFEGVFLDLIYSGRLLRERGIVFVDDAQLPSVRRAVDFCLANLGWFIEDHGEENEHHHWVAVRTSSHDTFLRPFRQFADF